ncbi:hypothetical protein A8709_20645 [Paenibacillus pectinilyticus]|uniref:Flagellar hook-associated protein 2 n=1 Tax=Paenibacillus pectinilyticus TaxID=512399 RepID=A0A1C0ZYH5_9BACL|nr:flagellar filament capping protein FliD [Paenibacillus pectinilyticus]OCT13156.1 hypothetical protein A8709_20645 [Paenibacillus pectinilyticus]
MSTTSVNRISGMVSGLDTDSLVKKLMAAESVNLIKSKQKLQTLTWQSDGYRQWNTDMFSFRTNTLFNMKLSKSYDTFATTTSDSNSLSGIASSDVIEGTYSYKVTNLAQSATMKSNVDIDTTKALTDTATSITIKATNSTGTQVSADIAVAKTDTITDVLAKINSAKDSSGNSLGVKAVYDSSLKQFIVKTKDTGSLTKLTINATPDKVPPTPESTASFVAGQALLDSTLGFNNSADGDYSNGFSKVSAAYVTVQRTSATRVPDTNVTTNPNYVKGSSGLVKMNTPSDATDGASITVDGTAFNIAAALQKDWTGKSLTDVVNSLKSVTSGTTKLSDLVDISTNGTDISFKSKSTGPSSSIAISAGTGTLKDAVANLFSVDIASHAATDLGNFVGTGVTDPNNPNVAQDAKINFNGTNLTSTSNSLKILGVNYTLKNVNATAQTVTITKDIDAEVKNITDFVSKYNDMLSKINTAVNETVYKDYQPLTDDQRTAMSETQITAWETKAKSGLFNNDSILKQLATKIRNDMTSKVDNGSTYNSLASIGINSTSYADKGKLYVDETKLRAAIQADPDAVKSLFSQTSTDTTSNAKQGVVSRLYDDFQSAMTKLVSKAGSSSNAPTDQSFVGKLLTQTNTFISTETDRLNAKEKNYYAKFTAMETAMNKYNSQSAYLTQNSSSQ